MRIRKNFQKNESDFGIFCTLLKKPDVSPEKKNFSINLVYILQKKSLKNENQMFWVNAVSTIFHMTTTYQMLNAKHV